jgi:hypothetical protein
MDEKTLDGQGWGDVSARAAWASYLLEQALRLLRVRPISLEELMHHRQRHCLQRLPLQVLPIRSIEADAHAD